MLRPNLELQDLSWGQTTRRGGVSSGAYAAFNLAGHVGEADEVTATNWRRFGRATGWQRASIATTEQVHGTEILRVRAGGHHAGMQADALISTKRGLAVGVYTADCVPVLLAACDSSGQVLGVAAAHCGWRGAAAGLASKAALALRAAVEKDDTVVYAWLGASIVADSYEVGPEVASRFSAAHQRPGKGHRFQLDVAGAVVADLRAVGLALERIECCQLDTYAEDEQLYSYRRDGAGTGRMLSFVGWRG